MVFDNIMNQYVDRSAFARHYRASGEMELRRRGSTLRAGHLGDDQYEDEEARHKRMTAFNEEAMAAARAELAGMSDSDADAEKDAVSSVGSGSLRFETESQTKLREEEEKVAKRETFDMQEEEVIMREFLEKEKVVLKEIEETEAVKRAEIAVREAEEREMREKEEREQKIYEALQERKRRVTQAKGRLMKAEEEEYERHMKRLERKLSKTRPKENSIHLKGRNSSTDALKAIHAQELLYKAALGAEASGVAGALRGHRQSMRDMKMFAEMQSKAELAPSMEDFRKSAKEELVSRIKVKRVKKPNSLGELKKKLNEDKVNPELKSEMGKSMLRRTISTNAQIINMKAAAQKAQQERLMKKTMVHGSWEKGTSHLFWSGGDCSAVPARKSSSLTSGDEVSRWLGYGKDVSRDREVPFYTGRPVIPIVWNKPPKPKPYVREAGEEKKDETEGGEGPSSTNTPTPSSPPATPERVRPSTTGGISPKRGGGSTR